MIFSTQFLLEEHESLVHPPHITFYIFKPQTTEYKLSAYFLLCVYC